MTARFWTKRTGSELWAQRALPPGPLSQHLTALHALLCHLGADGDLLKVAEHHLRDIAIHSHAQNPTPASGPFDCLGYPLGTTCVCAWRGECDQRAERA